MLKLFVGETFCLPRNFWFRKLMGRRERAGVTIIGRKFLVSQYQKLFVDNPFCVSERLAYQKFLIGKRVGEAQLFVDCFLSLTVLIFFVEDPFCLPRTFWYRKFLRKREKAGVTIFHRNFLVSQNRNNSKRNFSAFHYISGIGKKYW